MGALAKVWLAVGITAVVAFCAVWAWGYGTSGRYRKSRQRVQLLVAEALRDTGEGTFLFILSANARNLEVRLNAAPERLQQFQQLLVSRIARVTPNTNVRVVALKENLEHLKGTVAVWGRLYGDVYVATGGTADAA